MSIHISTIEWRIVMDLTMIAELISNIDNPAIVFDSDGGIVCKNKQFEYVYEYLDVDELESLSQVKVIRDNSENPKIKYFNIVNTYLQGTEYLIKNEDGGRFYLYIFERTFILDEMISNVIEHIDEIVVLFDENGTLRKMNGICDELLPFKRNEVLGKNISELVIENKVENPVITEMINKRTKVYRDIVYSDGRVISYTAVPIIDKDGILKGGVLTGRDVSRLINLAKKQEKKDHYTIDYISESPQIKKIKSIISRVAPSDAPVFIIGESGVGKEIIANTVWNQSKRRDESFVAINCASIPEDLIESELFGYEKGSFTGANKDGKMGLIEAADGGTIFLDEIGELPLETQKKLLRVIQENAILRIGAIKPKKVDVRYICATNKTKEELKDPKIFRQDLYYRLNVIPLIIPPLRERKEDILLISDFYIQLFNKRYNRKIVMTKDAEKLLLKNKWEGNIRELKNVIERLVILSPHENIYSEQLERILTLGNIDNIDHVDNLYSGENNEELSRNSNIGFERASENIEINDIYSDEGEKNAEADEFATDFGERILSRINNSENITIDLAHQIIEEELLKNALCKFGNISDASKSLGINPSTVYRKIKKGYINLD